MKYPTVGKAALQGLKALLITRCKPYPSVKPRKLFMQSFVVCPQVQEFAETGKSPQLADCLQVRLSHTGPDWLPHPQHLWPCHQAGGALLAHGCPLHTITLQRESQGQKMLFSPSVKQRTIAWGYMAVNSGKTLTDFREL